MWSVVIGWNVDLAVSCQQFLFLFYFIWVSKKGFTYLQVNVNQCFFFWWRIFAFSQHEKYDFKRHTKDFCEKNWS